MLALMKQQPAWDSSFVTGEMECKNLYKRSEKVYFVYGSTFILCYVNCRTSVAHMDSPNIVEIGLSQMLSLVVDHDLDPDLDVFFFISIDVMFSLMIFGLLVSIPITN